MAYVGVVIAAYLLGSIPTAYLLARWRKGVDIRCVGDGNAGAGNVYRQVGAGTGVLTGAVDVAKGAAAVFIADRTQVPMAVAMLSGLAVVVGHNWPVFLNFRGGRGAAAAVGVLLAVIPGPVLVLTAAGLVPWYIARKMTVGLAILFAPLGLVAWAMGEPWPLVGYAVGLPAFVGICHFLTTRQARPASCKEAPDPGNGK